MEECFVNATTWQNVGIPANLVTWKFVITADLGKWGAAHFNF